VKGASLKRDSLDAHIPVVNPPQDQSRHVNPLSFRKGIKFDSEENWLEFKHKFNRYYQVRQWTPEEVRDNLCWCLVGMASDFYAKVVARIHYIHGVWVYTISSEGLAPTSHSGIRTGDEKITRIKFTMIKANDTDILMTSVNVLFSLINIEV
jgi:hypothetical protein